MSEPNETYAYFSIASPGLDPALITQETGVAATDSWKKGERNPRNGFERKFGRWSLYSRLPRSEMLEEHVADVLAQLDANPIAFHKASRTHEGRMQLVGYFHSYYPGLYLTPEIIEKLAQYSLAVDCDFYYLYSDSRDDTDT